MITVGKRGYYTVILRNLDFSEAKVHVEGEIIPWSIPEFALPLLPILNEFATFPSPATFKAGGDGMIFALLSLIPFLLPLLLKLLPILYDFIST